MMCSLLIICKANLEDCNEIFFVDWSVDRKHDDRIVLEEVKVVGEYPLCQSLLLSW